MKAAVAILFCGLMGVTVHGQQVVVSQLQKINSSAYSVNILGKTPEGILIHVSARDRQYVFAYYDNMQLRWKKELPAVSRWAVLHDVLLLEDSLVVYYTVPYRGASILFALKTDLRLQPGGPTYVCDTLPASPLLAPPKPQFRLAANKQVVLMYLEDASFRSNGLVHVMCLDKGRTPVWKQSVRLDNASETEIFDAAVDSFGNALLIAGLLRGYRVFTKALPYGELLLVDIANNGIQRNMHRLSGEGYTLSACRLAEGDSNRLLLAGLFNASTGKEAAGFYFFSFDRKRGQVAVRAFLHQSEAQLEALLNRNVRQRLVWNDFKPVALIPQRGGGALLLIESQVINTETYPNPTFGMIGRMSGFSVNYYHYDDVAAVSIGPSGQTLWQVVLRKKQTSEGDGGYYSSVATCVLPGRAYFLYNDFTGGNIVISYYAVSAHGQAERKELFAAGRRNLWPVLRSSRQISASEMVIPSIRKNQLHFIKIDF